MTKTRGTSTVQPKDYFAALRLRRRLVAAQPTSELQRRLAERSAA